MRNLLHQALKEIPCSLRGFSITLIIGHENILENTLGNTLEYTLGNTLENTLGNAPTNAPTNTPTKTPSRVSCSEKDTKNVQQLQTAARL